MNNTKLVTIHIHDATVLIIKNNKKTTFSLSGINNMFTVHSGMISNYQPMHD